jgi:hypothetical protein
LANTNVDEFHELFKNEQGHILSNYIDRCLEFGRYGNASDQQKIIGLNAKQALIKIAKESNLNKVRLEKFGINIITAIDI